MVARASVTSRASLLAPPPPLELFETTVMLSVSAMAEETRAVTSGSCPQISRIKSEPF